MNRAAAASATTVLRLGTRKSALAMAQANAVADALRAAGSQIELVGVTTEGDRSSAPLVESGGLGVFVTELRTRLLDGTLDVVVHSLKDLPTTPAADLRVVAIPPRADARDALVARDGLTLSELPVGASIGTGSLRRAAQLLAARPDLDVRPLRGNVDTRLGKVAAGALDAIVVAAAGLQRLGRLDEATELLDVALMVPDLVKARWPSNAALPTSNRVVGSARCSSRSTTPPAGPLSRPNERCSRCSRRAVRHRSGLSRRSTAPPICIWSRRSSALTA